MPAALTEADVTVYKLYEIIFFKVGCHLQCVSMCCIRFGIRVWDWMGCLFMCEL